MRRRDFLASFGATAAIGVAGCTETGPGGTPGDAPRTTTDGSPTPSASPETDSPTGGPDVVLGEAYLITEDRGYFTDTYVEGAVTNEGTAPSGRITLTATWFDGNDNELGEDRNSLQVLRLDEEWEAHVHASADQADIADYELDLEFDRAAPAAPEGVDLLNSEHTIDSDGNVRVSGRARNDTGETLNRLAAIGRLRAPGQSILSDTWTSVSDVPAGDTWQFELNWARFDRANHIETHEVVFDATVS